MKNKILVTENISIEVSLAEIEIFTKLPFDIQVKFEQTATPTLDTDGEVFGKKYQIDISATPKYLNKCFDESDVADTINDYRELKTFWKFVKNNKQNLFDMACYKGELVE